MSTTTIGKAAAKGIGVRVLNEGYGPGAWHGPDLKAALGDVASTGAFRRPGPGRHNIAEIAVHHAYYVHSVRERITGAPAEPFLLEGEDWFELDDESALRWPDIQEVVQAEQQKLADVVAAVEAGRIESPLSDAERFDVVLGITCHAVYHAGQVQLIKRLIGHRA
jgi:DinB superfamily